MDYFYLLILVFLLLLACSDLFVGVSNDAVNFLSGALGSRIASFKTVMIVASLGVLFGATFSGGMMTIARSGVLEPGNVFLRKLDDRLLCRGDHRSFAFESL